MLKFSGSSYLIWDQGSEQSSLFFAESANGVVLSPLSSTKKRLSITHSITFPSETRQLPFQQYFSSQSDRQDSIPIATWGLRISRYSNRHALRNTRERNMRSKIRWFTEFCNSHYVSHFAAFFIVARAKRSVVKSCFLFVQENQDAFNTWLKQAVSLSRLSQVSPRTFTVHTV